jgi:hypothetical protein
MSALPPRADIRERIQYVCFVPQADIRCEEYRPPKLVAQNGNADGAELGASQRRASKDACDAKYLDHRRHGKNGWRATRYWIVSEVSRGTAV